MTRRLENKTALVTGSTSNIGREVAVAFGGEGAHVIVSGRDDARGQAVVARIRDAGGKADYVRADLDGAVASRALAEEAAGLHPAAIAAAAVYLASDEAAFVHGAVLDVDEGRVNVLTSSDATAVRP
jgi:NAD(P)-dependent dehydrogenase (short-subunit alcohol dehydrogenase family)